MGKGGICLPSALTARRHETGDAEESEDERQDKRLAAGLRLQMWRCRHNAYRADGANGQYILVLPDKDAVIAVTANIPDMQAELNLIWKYLLPAL